MLDSLNSSRSTQETCVEEIQAKQRKQEELRQSKNDEQFTSVVLIEAKLLDMLDDFIERLLVIVASNVLLR